MNGLGKSHFTKIGNDKPAGFPVHRRCDLFFQSHQQMRKRTIYPNTNTFSSRDNLFFCNCLSFYPIKKVCQHRLDVFPQIAGHHNEEKIIARLEPP